MNDITTAGLIFNAATIPFSLFMRLCNEHDPHEIFSGSSFLKELGLTDAQITRVSSYLVNGDWAQRELEKLAKLGARFITAKDLDYPAKLFDLDRPPVGLYVKGKANLSLPSAAIVGTRKPGSYGQSVAGNLARALAKSGVLTISGGAQGIDSAAHRGSLAENGITAAVFGTSIDKVYPQQNRDLFSRITERGAVVSEYPTGIPGEAWHFSSRNRIIAALASRVVIVEAGGKSGAMITARYAEELGRELWAVPGRITEENSRGTNGLLSRGAKCLYDVGEFVESFGVRHEQLDLFSDGGSERVSETPDPEMTDSEKIIYSLLQKKGSRLLEEVVSESRLDDSEVQMSLITLQAEGLISEVSGRYSAMN